MQVTHNLAQDLLRVIIVPVEKRKGSRICQTARGCTVADESRCVTYISPWKTQTTVFLLWLTPPLNHTWCFPQGGCQCWKTELFTRFVSILRQLQMPETSFTGVHKVPLHVLHRRLFIFHSLTLPTGDISLRGLETDKMQKVICMKVWLNTS